jgi:hypothetical protein
MAGEKDAPDSGDSPFAYDAAAPDAWDPALASDDRSGLTADQCVIRGERFFARGILVIPVLDAEPDFEWGVWMEISEGSFERMSDLWETAQREREPPYPGWLANDLPAYEQPTVGMLGRMKTRPVGKRPHIEVSATEHPLAVEQREGITVARVHEIAAALARRGS